VLVGADMPGSNLKRSKLAKSQIDSADLRGADLTGADLNEVSFTSSVLEECKFVDADLRSVDLTGAVLGRTVFGNADLRNARGLETVRHATPSILDFRTLQASGALPHAFLRGCGVPDRIIEYLPALFGGAIRFYSVFLDTLMLTHNSLNGCTMTCRHAESERGLLLTILESDRVSVKQ